MQGTVCLLFSVLVTACLARSRFHFEKGKTVEETLRTVTGFDQNAIKRMKTGRGHAINCGPKGTRLNASWVPEPIIVGDDAKMHMIVSMVTVTTLSKLALDIEIFFGNGTEGVPAFRLTATKNCTEAQELFHNLECPVKKGALLNLKFSRNTNITPGVYTVKLNINNEKGEHFMCLEMVVNLKAPGDFRKYQ